MVGLHEPEAVARLQGAGLSPQVLREYSPTVPVNVVMAQLPDRSWLAVQPRRRANWWIWAVTAALLALLLLAAFLLFGRGASATVPSVVGQDQASAVAELSQAGFTASPSAAQIETDAPAGTVIAQDPAAGSRLKRGAVVAIQVLSAPSGVEVPRVVGQTRETAVSRLQQAGFKVSVVEQLTGTAPAGQVIEQRPPAGANAEPGATVTIVVARSNRAENAAVPNVVGLVQADAESTIEDAGLRTVVVQNPSADVAVGVVALQSPRSGVSVAVGATVGLVVSSGPPEDATTTQVPDVVGDPLSAAQATISDAGLSTQIVPVTGTGEDRNTVVAQLPAAGAAISPGSTLILFYAQ